MNSGDTAWVLAASALVLLMTPGLAFFYGGMTRVKSTLNMMMMSFITIGIVSILWVIFGFALAFGHGTSSLYGNFGLSQLGTSVSQEVTVNGGVYAIPVLVFAAFQLMFAIITPALISGAIADRTKFLAWGVFVTFWVSIVYFPVAHWVFDFGTKDGTGAGWLAHLGVEDFAGGTAVHINAGAAGLALALVLGKRIGWKKDPMRPHNLPLVLIGAGLLWFGWCIHHAVGIRDPWHPCRRYLCLRSWTEVQDRFRRLPRRCRRPPSRRNHRLLVHRLLRHEGNQLGGR